MAFDTMKWIRSVRNKIWEETKDMSPEAHIDYIRKSAQQFRKSENLRKKKRHTTS
jgi:hypothetical protein